MKKYYISAIVIFLVIMIGSARADDADYSKPLEVAKGFCQSEFEGNPDQDQRDVLAKFSKKRENAAIKKGGKLGASWFDMSAYPLIVITGYEITGVTMKGHSANVSVVYQQVAKTSGAGVYDRRFVKDIKPSQIVTIQMVNEKNRWWVYDPGLPRVSKDVLLNSEKRLYDLYIEGERKHQLLPFEQKHIPLVKHNIEVLESLPGSPVMK